MADEEAEEAGVWTVLQRNLGKGKVVFEGAEADARKFIADHFPRVHVEPGSSEAPTPDAKLVSPDGKEETYAGPEAGFVSAEQEGDSE